MKEEDRRDQVKSQKCCLFQLLTGIDVTDADASGQEEDWCNHEKDDGDHQRGGSPEGLFKVSWVLKIPTDAV